MGNMILAATPSPSSTAAGAAGLGSYTPIIVILVLFGLMYFVMLRPQRNRQRQMMQMQSDVGPGAQVRTTAGMYATVTSVEGDDVVLEIAPGVNVRMLRRAIMEVVSSNGVVTGDVVTDDSASTTSADKSN